MCECASLLLGPLFLAYIQTSRGPCVKLLTGRCDFIIVCVRGFGMFQP